MEDSKIETPRWFWVVGALFLIWNLIGCSGYLAEHMISDAAYGKAFGPEKLAIRHITPVWATAGYAVGVWSGLIGVILLLRRKALCLRFFFASFLGALVGFLPVFIDSRVSSTMGPFDYGMMVFVWVMCFLFIHFAKRMRRRGILL